jgi:DNA-binding GntR family transcriptional regulator
MTKDIEVIYRRLQNEIITLRLKPGTRLGEVQLAKRFGVSRTPMRDVLKKLESDGLVRINSCSGSYVTKINLAGINDVMFLRSVVEQEVMLEAFDKITEEDVVELHKIIDRSKDVLSSEGKEEKIAAGFFQVDNDFHRAIFEKTGKADVLDLLNGSFPAFQRYRFLTFYRDESEIASLLTVHNKIVDCLEKKDKESLHSIVEEHNFSGLNGLDKVKERHPDYFID